MKAATLIIAITVVKKHLGMDTNRSHRICEWSCSLCWYSFAFYNQMMLLNRFLSSCSLLDL